jgi:hypothetical protein
MDKSSNVIQFGEENTMMTQILSSKLKFCLTVAFIFGIAGILAACSPSASLLSATLPTVTPASTQVCPAAPTPAPVSFDDLWKSSLHAKKDAAPFTHWDTATPQEIPVTCAKCHSRPGFLDYLGVDGTAAGVVDNPAKIGTTITCYVCHNEAASTLDSVTYPSGKRISGLGPEARCMTCHQGMASTESVNTAIAKAALATDDTPSPDLAFVNSHSISAATSFGTEAKGAYEYEGKTYQGRYVRGTEFFTCTRCHDQHTSKVKVDTCTQCHTFADNDVKNIRVNTTDYAGDGNPQEGVSYEVQNMHDKLLVAIQAYAKNVVGVPIVFDLSLHPYFFIDTNNNGVADPDELKAANKYNAWTPRLLRAAYNYNYVSHDKGAFAHNSTYVFQAMYDSLADIGGDVSGMTRP